MELIDVDDLLYETNENGENILVRPTNSSQRAFISFTNKANRHVDVWCRDFQGRRMHYICLKPLAVCELTTYVGHPWEFTDAVSREIYLIDNKRIFRAPKEIGEKDFTTNFDITTGVRTLRKICLLELAQLIRSPHDALRLDLPEVLMLDLQKTIFAYGTPFAYDSRDQPLVAHEVSPSGEIRLVKVY